MVKSYSFYSYKLNNDKFNYIKNYATNCVGYKNIISEYTTKNLLFDMYYNKYTSFAFINKTKHLRNKDIHSQIFQQIQKEVYTMYQNRLDIADVKLYNNKLKLYIKYMIKTYKNNKQEYINFINDRISAVSDKEFYKHILHLIDKFNDRLFNLVYKYQKLMLSFQLNFHSLTIPIINNVGSTKQDIYMYDVAHTMKISNGAITLNLNKKIIIPFKYNKHYHGNLKDYKYSQNNTTKQKQYSCILKIDNNRIRIISTKEEQDQIYNFDDITEMNTIGIDVNLKHNILALSNGKSVQVNKKFIKRANKVIEKQAKSRQTKDIRNIENKNNGKKLTNLINKQTKRNKAYIDYICNLLCKYCIKHNFTNISMEDLFIQGKIKGMDKDTNIKYKRLIKFIHLNDIKNVLPRIAKKFNINVHYVSAEYTSQTCSNCGYIDKKNRLNQETFSCKCCNYLINADYNASINILNRVIKDYLRNNLEVYKDYHYIGKYKHNKFNKSIYQNIYNNFYKSLKIY